MDFGEAKFILSTRLNAQLLIFPSQRQAGLVFKFHKKTADSYACASCKTLGKTRVIMVKDGRIVGKFFFILLVVLLLWTFSQPLMDCQCNGCMM
jgi:hypothetical protein